MLLGTGVRFKLLQVMSLVGTKILALSGVVRENSSDFYYNVCFQKISIPPPRMVVQF